MSPLFLPALARSTLASPPLHAVLPAVPPALSQEPAPLPDSRRDAGKRCFGDLALPASAHPSAHSEPRFERRGIHTPPAQARAGRTAHARPQRSAYLRPTSPAVLRSLYKTRQPAQIVYAPANLEDVFVCPQGAHSLI